MINLLGLIFLGLIFIIIGSECVSYLFDKKKEIERAANMSCPVQGILDSNGDCGYLDLPVDYSVKDGNTQLVFWFMTRAKNNSEKRGNIVLLSGGPGFSMSRLFLDFVYSPKWETLRTYYDIVSFDYRGVGLSDPLVLEALPFCDEEFIRTVDINELDFAMKTCKEILDKEEVMTSSINTATFVQDMDRILAHLNMDKVVLYGVSYGTRVALTAARDVPDRIKGLVLDGAFPIEVNGFSEAGRFLQSGLRYFFDIYQKEKELVPAQYGNLEQRILDMSSTNLVSDIRKILSFIAINAHDENRYVIADILLSAFEKNEGETLNNLISYFEYYNYNQILEYSYPYNNADLAQLQLRPISVLQAAMVDLAEEYAFFEEEDINKNIFKLPVSVFDHVKDYAHGLSISREKIPTIQNIFHVSPSPIIENKPVVSDIPTLIFSATRDTKTPAYWAEMLEENLENSYHILNRNAEHVYTRGNQCTLDIIDEFSQNPTKIHALERVACMNKVTKDLEPKFDVEQVMKVLDEIKNYLKYTSK